MNISCNERAAFEINEDVFGKNTGPKPLEGAFAFQYICLRTSNCADIVYSFFM